MTAIPIATGSLEARLQKLLTEFRYISSMGVGLRRLQPHHIGALMQDLVPFIKQEMNASHSAWVEACVYEHNEFNKLGGSKPAGI